MSSALKLTQNTLVAASIAIVYAPIEVIYAPVQMYLHRVIYYKCIYFYLYI